MESNIVNGFIYSKKFVQYILEYGWKNEYLMTEAAQSIVKWCTSYYSRYKKPPRGTIHNIYLNRMKKGRISEELADTIETYLDELEPITDEGYLVDMAVDFIEERKLEILSDRLDILIERGELEEATDLVYSYRKQTSEDDDEIDLADPLVLEYVKKAFDNKTTSVFTLSGALGDLLNPELVREGFVCFQAPEKRGKTWILMYLALAAARQGKNVALFQAGDMSTLQQLRRIGINLNRKSDQERYTGNILYPVKDCVLNQLDLCDNEDLRECDFGVFVGSEHDETNLYENLTHDMIKEAMELYPEYNNCYNCIRYRDNPKLHSVWLRQKVIKGTLGVNQAKKKFQEFFITPKRNFKIVSKPSGVLSFDYMDTKLEKWRQEGFETDVAIVDYMDIMETPKSTDFRQSQNENWKRGRAFSQSNNLLLISATQADAGSYKTDTMTMANFSEDKRKNAHVTAKFGLNQDSKGREKKLGIMRINPLVVREAEFDSNHCVKVLQSLKQGAPVLDSF
jgi:hypothetical protein